MNGSRVFNLIDHPWCIVTDGKYPATVKDPAGNKCVMFFNSRELAELTIENAKPKNLGQPAQLADPRKAARDMIATGLVWGCVDFAGGQTIMTFDLNQIASQQHEQN